MALAALGHRCRGGCVAAASVWSARPTNMCSHGACTGLNGSAALRLAVRLGTLRGVAKPGIAPHLGCGDRRFKSGRPDFLRVSPPRKVISGADTGQKTSRASQVWSKRRRAEANRCESRDSHEPQSATIRVSPRGRRSARAARPRPLRCDSGSCRQWIYAGGRVAAGARSSVASRSGGQQAVAWSPRARAVGARDHASWPEG